ncbi:MAG: TonB-dependent receptor plug domain-containing protein, partial [Woeseiaceae bacterium]
MKTFKLCYAASAALFTIAVVLPGQAALAQEKELIEEIVTLGTRAPGRVSSDLAVPVDTLTADDMAATGQTELGRMLQALAPSFNFSSSSISDGTDALRPATLRGLGPDQTLVLINGKRRHQASLIHINNSVGRGTAGTDMNAIPAAAIKRIEVLRDGAAAQYGSDAIAGVINIQLKDDDEGGALGLSVGEYTEGDGQTTNVDFNKGFTLGSDGYLNVTVNFRDRERTSRANPQGGCLYGGCVDTDGNGYLEPAPGNESREVNGPGRNAFRIGDADSEQVAIVANAGIALGDGELYSFVTYSGREGQSGAFYRNPAGSGAALDDGENVVIDGFLPLINSEIDDYSMNFGYRIDFDDDSRLDMSITQGRNSIDYTTSNSVNYSYVNELNFGQGLSDADIRAQIPRSAFAYGLELGLQTINIDYSTSVGEVFLALGAEVREDTYEIRPGDEYAYNDYDSFEGVAL